MCSAHYKKSCNQPRNYARSKNSWQIYQDQCQGKFLGNLPGVTPRKFHVLCLGGKQNLNTLCFCLCKSSVLSAFARCFAWECPSEMVKQIPKWHPLHACKYTCLPENAIKQLWLKIKNRTPQIHFLSFTHSLPLSSSLPSHHS